MLAAPALISACGRDGSNARASGPVKVVAAESFWGNIAAQLGGPRVRVTSIISGAGTDPHLYESSPRDAAAVADARLVIRNGAGYDDFARKLASGSSAKVLTVANVLGAHGGDTNPHFWYDVPRVADVARAIVDALTRIDPSGAPVYDANLSSFDASMQPLLDTITAIKTRHGHAPVAYTERVAEYLLDDAGLDVRTPPGFASAIEDGNEPSAGDARAMNRLVDTRAIRMLLYNTQATSKATSALRDRARRAGIPVVGVTETQPKSDPDYQHWQLRQLEAILAGLGG